MLYIGLMSGTSLDGIDAALIDIDEQGMPHLLASHYQSYDKPLQIRLFQLSQAAEVKLEELATLDQLLGRLYASCCLTLLRNMIIWPATFKPLAVTAKPSAINPDLMLLAYKLVMQT